MKARKIKDNPTPKERVSITKEQLDYLRDGIKSRDKKILELREGLSETALGVDAIVLVVALKFGTVAENGTITVELPMPNVEKLKEYSMCAGNLDGRYIITAVPKPKVAKEEVPCGKSE